jgi:GR25 family glycosyltransferase involved in LPS biosynthesis
MKNLISDVDIYCINLKNRLDRRLFMARQFKDLSVIKRSTFIRAVSANDLAKEDIIGGLSKEESACLFSHLKALEFFVNSKSDLAIILEDDCDLENLKRFNGSITDAIKLSNFKNFILQLAVLARPEDRFTQKIKKRTFWDFSSMAYLVDREYAEKLLKKFKNVDSINNYRAKRVLDPRTDQYFLPNNTAETILYSGDSYSIPIFTSKILGSSLNHKNANEALIQEQLSIQKTNELWSSQENIDLSNYIKRIDL